MRALYNKYTLLWFVITVFLFMGTATRALAVYPAISGDNTLEWITNVTFNTIDNTTDADTNGYGDYTAASTTVAPGTTYPLSVTIKPDTGEKISVFFDWNQNEAFTDPGEEVVVTPDIIQSPDPNSFTATINVNVPVTATLGTTRMRVVLSFLNADTDPVQSSGTLPAGEAEDYTVNVNNGSANPVITATATANGTITPSGAVSVTSGANQSFTIAADPGFFIDDVMVDGSSVGVVTSHTFTNVVADHTIHAVFSSTLNHTVTATAGANGSITPAGTVRIGDGSDQTFFIQPASGFLVNDVKVDGTSVGAVSSHTLTNVTADHTISADFAADTVAAVSSSDFSQEWITNVTFGAINNSSNAEGYGAFLDKNTIVQQGGAYPVAVTIHPQADENISVFVDWNHDGDFTDAGEETKVVELSPAAGPHVATVTVPTGAVLGTTRMRVVVRNFLAAISSGDLAAGNSGGEAEDYTVVVASPVPAIDASLGANPAFGTIAPPGHTAVASGTGVDVTVDVVDQVYFIEDVLVDGVSVGGPFSPLPYVYSFTGVVVTHTIQADFSNIPFQTITATAGPDGSISPFGALKVPVGANKVFMMTPNPGFVIKDVQVDGGSVGPVESYTFTNVTADHSITAMFSLFAEITVSAGPHGTISPAGVVKVALGNSQVFTITPDTGYAIKDVLVDNVSVGSVESYTFTNVTVPHQISASFEKTFPWPMFLPAIVNANRGA